MIRLRQEPHRKVVLIHEPADVALGPPVLFLEALSEDVAVWRIPIVSANITEKPHPQFLVTAMSAEIAFVRVQAKGSKPLDRILREIVFQRMLGRPQSRATFQGPCGGRGDPITEILQYVLALRKRYLTVRIGHNITHDQTARALAIKAYGTWRKLIRGAAMEVGMTVFGRSTKCVTGLPTPRICCAAPHSGQQFTLLVFGETDLHIREYFHRFIPAATCSPSPRTRRR